MIFEFTNIEEKEAIVLTSPMYFSNANMELKMILKMDMVGEDFRQKQLDCTIKEIKFI